MVTVAEALRLAEALKFVGDAVMACYVKYPRFALAVEADPEPDPAVERCPRCEGTGLVDTAPC